MAINKKALMTMLKHPVALVKVMMLCKDKTDVERYERLVKDDDFISVEANIDAFMQVMVSDTALWGGELWLAFLPTESDAEFMYGGGVTTAYTGALDVLACGIRETNPIISWVSHFFANRTSPSQKIDSFCLCALKTSLLPLCNEENVDKLYEVTEAVKTIPCEAWGNFLESFYPYYKDLMGEYSLVDILKSQN